MDEEKRQTIGLIALLGTIMVFALGWFIWGAFLNYAHIIIIAEAPYEITINEKFHECVTDTCKIKVRPNKYTVKAFKIGAYKMEFTLDLKIFDKEKIELKFQKTPYLQEIKELPETKSVQYGLENDSENSMQKLFKANDPYKKAIVYFKNPILKPLILGNENFVFVSDTSDDTKVYKIDVLNKTRKNFQISRASQVKNGKFSGEGKYFAYILGNGIKINMVVNNKIYDLQLNKNTLFDWNANNRLVFLTSQKYELIDGEGEYTGRYIKLNDGESENYILGIYVVETDQYAILGQLTEVKQMPDEMFTEENMKFIYLKMGGQNFRIILN